jgi:hypothetical protein
MKVGCLVKFSCIGTNISEESDSIFKVMVFLSRRRHIPEDNNIHIQSLENFESHKEQKTKRRKI